MQIILTEDVVGLGDIGDTVTVKPGYARNFLIPRGSAIESAAAGAKQLEHLRRQIDSKRRKLKVEAEARAQELASVALTFELRFGSGGKAFGSISNRDIAAKLAETGFELDRRRVVMNEPIKSAGEHQVMVKLHADVLVPISVTVNKIAAKSEEETAEADEARENIERAADAEEGEGDEFMLSDEASDVSEEDASDSSDEDSVSAS